MHRQLFAGKFRIRTGHLLSLLTAAAIALVGVGIAPGEVLADEDVGPVGALTFAGLADYDRDGHGDIVIRHNATGDLWLHPGTSLRGPSPQERIKSATAGGYYTGTFLNCHRARRNKHTNNIGFTTHKIAPPTSRVKTRGAG